MPPRNPSVVHLLQSPTVERRQDSINESEAASLGGQPAKTPIIAGSVCGGVLLIAWVIGFAIYFRKRQKRKERKRAAEEGLCDPPPEKGCPPPSAGENGEKGAGERIVIPPDPAVLLGYAKPGDIAHPAASRRSSSGAGNGSKGGVHHKRSDSNSNSRSGGHSRSGSTQSASGSASGKKRTRSMEQIPTPSRPLPLKSHSHHHKKSHSSSSGSHHHGKPSSPKRAHTDDEMTVPLNPHES